MVDLIAPAIDRLAPVTLLHAPAGSGKTVAALQWTDHALGLDAADIHWIEAPDQTSAPDQLYRRICAALGAEDGDGSPRERVEALVQGLERTMVLVIDEYQKVTSGELDFAIARLAVRSAHLHLLVCSRRFTSFDGPLVSSTVPVTIITGEDLAFTRDECVELAKLYGVGNLDRVEQLRQEMSGWPIVIRTLLQRVAADGASEDIPGLREQFTRMYLSETTAEEGRRAWYAALLFPEISRELLAELLDTGDPKQAEAVIDDLVEIGLLRDMIWPGTNRYRCHVSGGPSLERAAVQEFGEDAVREIRLRHTLDLGRDDPVAAVSQLLDVEEYEEASRLFARYFLAVTMPGSGILARLRRIPDEALREQPELLGAMLLLETPERDTSIDRLEQLFEWMREVMRRRILEGDYQENAAAIGLLFVAERMRGNGEGALRLARDAEARLSRLPARQMERHRFTAPLLFAAAALTGLVAGDLELAERGYRQDAETAAQFDNLVEQRRGHNGLALVAAFAGDVSEAERRLAHLAEFPDSARLPSPQASWAYRLLAEAMIACDAGDPDRSRDVLADVHLYMDRLEVWPLVVATKAHETWLSEGPQAALDALEPNLVEAQGRFVATPYLRRLVTAFAVRLHIAIGNFPVADRHWEALPENHPDVAVVGALLALNRGDAEVALQRADAAAQLDLRPKLQVENQFIRAAALWEMGDADSAIATFAAAGSEMYRYGMRFPFSDLPYSSLRDLTRAAEEAGAIDLVEAVDQVPEHLRRERFEPLSKAEQRTLEALATGLTQAKIAEKLFITENTVKFHLKNIYRKLGVSGRAEAVESARRTGLL